MSQAILALPWPNLLHRPISNGITFTTRATWTLSTTSSAVAVPLCLNETTEIDKFEVYLAAGACTDFRCRIVTSDATGLPTSTLSHANASETQAAVSADWNVFDFTNFSLSPGLFYIIVDCTSSPSVSLTLHYHLDYVSVVYEAIASSPLYWTGSAWATDGSRRSLRVRLKTSTGWMPLYPCAPLPGASGIDGLIMDTSENPACRGNRWIAPASGTVAGFDVCIAAFSSSTSFEFVVADEGCTTELARCEVFRNMVTTVEGVVRISFPPVTVVAGTAYDCYITAGSAAGASTGVSVVALDTSEDSGAVIGCYGVTPGDILGIYVHDPATEGGSDTPTTANHVFPWVPVYSEITTSGGGSGGETSHVFAS